MEQPHVCRIAFYSICMKAYNITFNTKNGIRNSSVFITVLIFFSDAHAYRAAVLTVRRSLQGLSVVSLKNEGKILKKVGKQIIV